MNGPAILLFCALCGMGSALGVAVRRLRLQAQSMENAAARIREYLLDRRKGGIACDEEGAMYRLFHEVNSLVTIADAHADSERQTKEFLRDTISDISHQLKTPIAALNIYNGILQQEAEDAATVRKFTALSEQELDRIESLVQSLLKMARLDAGVISLELLPENLSELLEHIRGQYSFRAEQEGKEMDLEGDEQAVLTCDRVWLSEAIGNLVKNSLDHTTRGDRIVIRWRQSPCLTTVAVEDTGSGIHPEDLYHIFKRFYRSRLRPSREGPERKPAAPKSTPCMAQESGGDTRVSPPLFVCRGQRSWPLAYFACAANIRCRCPAICALFSEIVASSHPTYGRSVSTNTPFSALQLTLKPRALPRSRSL